MLNRFAAAWRAPLLGAFFVVSLASCSTSLNRASPQPPLPSLAVNLDAESAARVDAWYSLRERLRSGPELPEQQKVELVNSFFNGLPWLPDDEIWGVEDYWATPLETLISGAGDCEDLAIAKYFTLLDAGIEEQRLRLSFVWRWREDERDAHLVVAYYPEEGSSPLILDNLIADTQVLDDRQELEKVYSFNRWNLWLAGDSTQTMTIASQDRLPKWREVNDRMLLDAEQARIVAL